MKFLVTMKDPDTLGDAIADAVRAEGAAMPGLDKDEQDAVMETRQEKISRATAKWFQFGEYLTIEIDTEAGTATVCPASA